MVKKLSPARAFKAFWNKPQRRRQFFKRIKGFEVFLLWSHSVFFHNFPEPAAPCRPAELFLV